MNTIFTLQQQIAADIEKAVTAEWALLEQYGEIEATIPQLQELQKARERLTAPYSPLHTLLLRILESQPLASPAMLKLLAQNIWKRNSNDEAILAYHLTLFLQQILSPSLASKCQSVLHS